MNVAIVAEHVRSLPWHHARWAIEIATRVAMRAECTTLICDAVEDRTLLDGVRVLEHSPRRTPRDRTPSLFQRWARAQLDELDADATISLTRLVPAGVWLPVDPPSWTSFKRSVWSLSPATVFLEGITRRWIVEAMRAERRAIRTAKAKGVLFCQLGGDPEGKPGLTRMLGLASTLAPEHAHRDARGRLRAHLDLAEDRPVLLCSLVDRNISVARSLFQAVARSRRSAGPPALLVLTRQPMRVHRLASSLGALSRVRILGSSTDMASIISACDAVALPALGTRGTARLIADAIAMHTPVIAAHGIAGAEIIEPSTYGGPPIGRVLNDVTPAGWQMALDQMLEPTTLQRMKASIASLAPTVGFDAFVDRLLAPA